MVPDTGAAMLKRTPAALPFASFNTFTATGALAADGKEKAHIEYVTRGDDELVMRTLLRHIPPGQWEQFVQELSRRIGFGGTTSNVEAGRPDTTVDPQKLAYDYEREKPGDWDNYRILPLFPLVFLPAVDEKDPPKQAIDLGEPRVETAKTVLTLPAG